ncbi:MAG: tetratricopeptide repeat protein [Gammaproteobacteria bacterium]|nr:tetratricopeptide repeat protein [Gammaproteobacteria bacterium]
MKKQKKPRRRSKPRPGGKRAAAAREETRQLLGTAVRLLQIGQLSRARSLFEQVLEREPRNADGLQFFGLFCFECGEVDRARELIESAIAENPRVAPYHDNLGKVLESQGDLDQALTAFLKANELEPGVADRKFNMGVVLQRMGRLEDAERQLRQAIDSQPKDADYLFNLGVVLKAQGRHVEAVSAYQDALSLKPQSSNIKNNLGNALLLSGDAPGAVEVLREAVSRSPGNAHIHNNLGNALREIGDLDGAVKSYRRALEIDSSLIDAHKNLGNVLLYSGQLEEAARVFLRALNFSPDSPEIRRGFVSAVRHLEVNTHDHALEAAIQSCMSADDVHAQELARVAAGQLRARHGLDSADTGSPDAAALALAGDEYALRLLEKTINVDPVLESVLIDIRRWLLGLAGGVILDSLFRLACALAQQCFSNEFVFEEDLSETQAVNGYAKDLQAALSSKELDDPRLFSLILRVALYRPLYLLDSAEALAGMSQLKRWPDPLSALMERALIAPRQEARMETRIPCLKPISDPTSLAVKNQYEDHPYPRWLDLPRREQRTYGDVLKRSFLHFEPPASLNGPVRVLVAGCGTGSEALAVARNRICARVVAVDLSRTSLAYALRMAEKLEVENVEFFQADVLDLPSAGDRYEVVESSGVLHHLADPIAGWKALTECLVPGGVMKLGLYSESARQAVVKARELIREWDLNADVQGIRRIRSRIIQSGAEDPLHELSESEDLYTTSACRDLLFHVCEHRFTLDKIRNRLDDLGLRFIGFKMPFSFMQHRFRLVNPGNSNMQDLDAWARVERRYPDTFAAMYVFWCQKPE